MKPTTARRPLPPLQRSAHPYIYNPTHTCHAPHEQASKMDVRTFLSSAAFLAFLTRPRGKTSSLAVYSFSRCTFACRDSTCFSVGLWVWGCVGLDSMEDDELPAT